MQSNEQIISALEARKANYKVADNGDIVEVLLWKRENVDDTLRELRDARCIEVLSLVRSDLTDRGLEYIGHFFPKLRELNVSGTQITGRGLAHLRGLPDLEELNASPSVDADLGVLHLVGLQSLKRISLSWAAISDEGLIPLKEIQSLREIGLFNTKITGSSFSKLTALYKNLANGKSRRLKDETVAAQSRICQFAKR